MNKFYNALLLLVFFPTMLLCIIVGFDVPLAFLHTTGANLRFHKEILLLLGVFIVMINFRRSIRRWVAMRLVNKIDQYRFNTVVSPVRLKRIYLYNFLEAGIFTAAGLGLYGLTEAAWMPALALFVTALDAVVFAVLGAKGNKFRVGLTSKALLAGDRDVSIIYFKGLRRVSVQQQTIFFDFRDDLQHRFPIDLIPTEKRHEFFEHLKACTDETKVYFQNNI